jgi:hypothetical protein
VAKIIEQWPSASLAYRAAKLGWLAANLLLDSVQCSDAGHRLADAVPADGRTLPIASFMAIFSLMGTNFGGDGVTSFNIPDLRAFAPKDLQYSISVEGIYPSGN